MNIMQIEDLLTAYDLGFLTKENKKGIEDLINLMIGIELEASKTISKDVLLKAAIEATKMQFKYLEKS